MITRVKVCGITSVEDAIQAVSCGVHAIGLVFYDKSPRHVSIQQAREIAQALPPFVSCVGLFVDAPADYVEAVLSKVKLTCLQFHGDESADYCAQFDRPWIKGIRMREGIDLDAEFSRYAEASGWLLDAYKKGVPGGTGERFDWHLVPPEFASRIILAGGLTPANVTKAITHARPYAVDVSGGVEAAPGRKDHDKISAFCGEVAGATSEIKSEQ
ncbi:phosphoribosylanthranilate isomerase [Sinobacterium caligoides]|uniref:N-(5'-phosphoribosyl)anthranilate isomerase n=1 Tax=Sinobacterium caligoides TaxID=933926 RepID=A0A3N2DJL6_9GAMM|nr:phosphoribosylanthranilate isomerase [Sinobacterium caligoides]ROR99967.1 phosphoribosylanthranilate isomerase [Sinobacterium caligoides]